MASERSWLAGFPQIGHSLAPRGPERSQRAPRSEPDVRPYRTPPIANRRGPERPSLGEFLADPPGSPDSACCRSRTQAGVAVYRRFGFQRGVNRTGFCGGLGLPRVSRGQLAGSWTMMREEDALERVSRQRESRSRPLRRGGLLTDLLTDNLPRGGIHKYQMALRDRELPAQRHCPAPPDIA